MSNTRLNPQTSHTGSSGGAPESSSTRKRHQKPPDEQKEGAQPKGKGFKTPSGIPVRKTQKLSSVKPVQTSTPVSKPRKGAGMGSMVSSGGQATQERGADVDEMRDVTPLRDEEIGDGRD